MEKASVDTSNIEEKAEEIIAEAEPPPEVYLYWVALYSNKMYNIFFVCFYQGYNVHIEICFGGNHTSSFSQLKNIHFSILRTNFELGDVAHWYCTFLAVYKALGSIPVL